MAKRKTPKPWLYNKNPPRDAKGRFIKKVEVEQDTADAEVEVEARPKVTQGDEKRAGVKKGTFTNKPYGPEFKGNREWVAHPATDPYQRHTYYMLVQVEGSGRGIAYEYEDIDADAPDQYATIALTGQTKDGRVVGLKYAELVRNFRQIATRAISRAGVYPKGDLKDAIVAVFRHKEK